MELTLPNIEEEEEEEEDGTNQSAKKNELLQLQNGNAHAKSRYRFVGHAPVFPGGRFCRKKVAIMERNQTASCTEQSCGAGQADQLQEHQGSDRVPRRPVQHQLLLHHHHHRRGNIRPSPHRLRHLTPAGHLRQSTSASAKTRSVQVHVPHLGGADFGIDGILLCEQPERQLCVLGVHADGWYSG